MFKRYDGPDQVAFADVTRPMPKPDEILVQVHAAGLNPSRRGEAFASLDPARRPAADFVGDEPLRTGGSGGVVRAIGGKHANLVAAAVRATQAKGDPVRVFVAVVRRKLWHHITLEQEERAARALGRYSDSYRYQFRRAVLGRGLEHRSEAVESAGQVLNAELLGLIGKPTGFSLTTKLTSIRGSVESTEQGPEYVSSS